MTQAEKFPDPFCSRAMLICSIIWLGKLVAWDGTTDGAAVGILAVAADQTSTTLTFYKSGTFRYEDVLWPEAASDETKKRTAFAGTAISIV